MLDVGAELFYFIFIKCILRLTGTDIHIVANASITESLAPCSVAPESVDQTVPMGQISNRILTKVNPAWSLLISN